MRLAFLSVALLAGCQTPETFTAGGQSYCDDDFRYVDQAIAVSTYQFPVRRIGARELVRVRLGARDSPPEAVELRGRVTPRMAALAKAYSARPEAEVFVIDFLNGAGKQVVSQSVAFASLRDEQEGYSFSFELPIDATRFDAVESAEIGAAAMLDEAVEAHLATDEGKAAADQR